MKKRLLFALMAMCVAVSGFALEKNEYVYTPQGRFLITGDNQNANSAFQSMDGWTAFDEGKTIADLFNTNGNGYKDGYNSIQSIVDHVYNKKEDNVGTGIYFKFVPTSAGDTYVVSFKMKGAALDKIQQRIAGDGYQTETNLVKISGNTDGTYMYPETAGEVVVNTAEELTEDWQTFNYAIVGDGTTRTWFISFANMVTTIEIADLQIASAIQVADLRQRDAMLEKMKAYRDCYDWKEEVWAKFDGYPEVIAALEEIGDASGQAELDELLTTAQEVLKEFLDENMDDYLSSDNANYLGVNPDEKNINKLEYIGEWYGLPEKRIHWNGNSYPDFGHFVGNNTWCLGNPDSPMGAYLQKTLDPGSYVFAIDALAHLREDATSTCWTPCDGWNPAYGVAYIVKINDGVAGDTIVSVVKDLDAVNYTTLIASCKITERGTYEIGLKAYCKDAYKELKNGSTVYLKDASILGKNDNKYNQRELTYEANVRTQITTGRENLTKAAEYLADESYLWGKAALKAVVDEIEPKIAAYETLDQDAIIATYDKEVYVNSTSDEAGLLQYEVYQQATKFILAANKEFLAENDTLNSMQPVIENAEKTIAMRLYDAATGKAALQAAIDKAKDIQAQMKASQYSEENAAAIVEANAELNAAIALFTTTIPADCIATIVDIDFEKNAEWDEDFINHILPGAKGSMTITNFSDGAATESIESEKGYWDNGEQLWKGYLRVGASTGTVSFDPTENGSMGTNILKVACDFYIQGLSGRNLGFFLKDAEDNTICGLYRNYYDGKDDTNTFDADMSKVWAKSGGSYANASPADATDSVTANPLEKTHFEVIMDYGRKSMYCTITSPNGSTTSNEIALEAIPTQFILQSNYNNNDRRAWFDNLLIQRITAGATDPFDPAGIDVIKAAPKADESIYTLSGQKLMTAPTKGIYIQNGKKFVVK